MAASFITKTIHIKGMCCPRCIRALHDELVKLAPARLSIRIGEVEIEYDSQLISRQQIDAAIEDAGFEVLTLLKERKIEQAKQYVRDHLREPEALRLSLLSRALATSPFHLSRTFSLHEGETLQDFIMRARMERAGQLLRETERTVLDICGEVGLSSPSHFTKEFKRHFGRTPLKYRRAPGAPRAFLQRLAADSAAVAARLWRTFEERSFPSHGRHFPVKKR